MSDPIVSVIIVTYNSRSEIEACFESLQEQETTLEVFVVDNASADGTVGLLNECSEKWSALRLILNDSNRGLACANNQPMHMCRGKYILILNPDVVLQKKSLARMVDYLESNRDAGVIGPLCLNEDGSPHSSCHKHWTALHMMAWRLLPFQIMRRLCDKWSTYREQDVLFVSGACLLIRRKLFIELDGYDECYFLTVEDAADVCLRARRKGYRTLFYPEARVAHLAGKSHAGTPYISMYYGYHGSLHYLKKHHGVLQASLMRLSYLSHAVLKTIAAAPFLLFSQRFRGVARNSMKIAKAMLVESSHQRIGAEGP